LGHSASKPIINYGIDYSREFFVGTLGTFGTWKYFFRKSPEMDDIALNCPFMLFLPFG
jgi:hypothetical protein